MDLSNLGGRHIDRPGGGDIELPPGYRFHPTDEELVCYYLLKKVMNSSYTCRAITQVDLNKCEPWQLPEKAKMGEKECIWYMFTLRDRKYPTGLRTNRATEAGYWKATGKDREIYSSKTCFLAGMRKTLVFYHGRAPNGVKSNWVMHEYRLEGQFAYRSLLSIRKSQEEWVISRVFQKTKKSYGTEWKKTRMIAEPSSPSSSSASLPPLLDSNGNANSLTVDRDSCSHDNHSLRERVSCFSTGANMSSFNNLISPQPQTSSLYGLSDIPSLRSLQENNLHAQLPFFFQQGMQPPPHPYSSAWSELGNWC